MRTACWIGACLGLLAGALDARAQSAETSWGVTTIVAPQVEAWSGPNQDKNYPTNLLSQSQQVTVKCDKVGRPIVIPDINDKHPGWLEIKPPQGSFSWVHQRFIKKQISGNTWVVDAEGPVGIYVGSRRVPDEPKVERVQLSKGTQVVVLDAPMPGKSGGYYYPIASPENEPRYIPANAINKTQVTFGGPTASRPGGVAQVSNTVPAAAASSSYADLFARADAAERLGKKADAKALFEAAQRATNDPQEKLRCANRIDSLQRGNTAVAGGWNIGGPNRPVAGTTALYTATKPSPRALVPGQRQWSEWGVLKKTSLPPIDGQEVYRLEVNGVPYAYATAQPGFTLSSYAGRYLTLYGMVSSSPPDDAMRVMRISVQHVSLQQPR
jgi:hypothetical protein